MVSKAPTWAGQEITVPKGLRAKCGPCETVLVTEGTERAIVVEEMMVNSKFPYPTGDAAVNLPCPYHGGLVQFNLGVPIERR
jgi:hypothetical protein